MKIRAALAHKSKKLDDDQIYDATAQCPLCGSTQTRKPAATIQEKPSIFLLACKVCGGFSASRMPRPEILDEYYSQYYNDSYYDNKQGRHVTYYAPTRFARHILKFIPDDFLQKPVRILDFGGGDGTLSAEIACLVKTRPIHITVVDYDENKIAVQEGVTMEKRKDLMDIDIPYDIVLASAVLEHIPEPGAIMEKLFSILIPGGYFYARTPYILPFMKIMKHIDFSYPGHVHDMGPQFWNRLTETFSLNADIIASRPSIVAKGFSPKLFIRTLAAYVLKFPAFVELAFNKKRTPLWGYVGGWEIVLKKRKSV